MTTVKLDSLRQLDLDERQVQIYHALLDLGPASIRDVAARAGRDVEAPPCAAPAQGRQASLRPDRG